MICMSGGYTINFVEERILKEGIVKPGNVLKVDSFLNHQIDVVLLDKIAQEFASRLAGRLLPRC